MKDFFINLITHPYTQVFLIAFGVTLGFTLAFALTDLINGD